MKFSSALHQYEPSNVKFENIVFAIDFSGLVQNQGDQRGLGDSKADQGKSGTMPFISEFQKK